MTQQELKKLIAEEAVVWRISTQALRDYENCAPHSAEAVCSYYRFLETQRAWHRVASKLSALK